MRRALVGIAALAAALALAQSVWTPIGPNLFSVLCGAISASSPRTAIVAVGRGAVATLYLTTDRGSTWSTVSDSLAFRPLAISFRPGSDSVLYAAALNAYKSTDRGQTWSQLGTPDGTVWLNLATNPNEVWLAGYSDASGRGRASVALSTDAGANWTMVVCDTTLRSSAHSVTRDPIHDSTIYCGGSIAGQPVVYKSSNMGSTWSTHLLPTSEISESIEPCSPPAHDEPVLGRIRFLYVDPLDPNTLLAAQSWYGVSRSTDAGVTWSHYTGIHEAHSLAFSPPQPQAVYIGTTNGICMTGDAGGKWSGPYQPPYSGIVDCILAFADSAYRALATNGSGVLRAIDQWGDWGSLAVLDTVSVTALAVSGIAAQNVYAAIAGFGLFGSTDHGQDWYRCRSLPGSDSVVSLAASPNHVWALADAGLYHSADAGGAWIFKGDWFDSVGAVTVSPLPPNAIVATGRGVDTSHVSGFMVSVSSNGGMSWEQSLLCPGGRGRAVVASPVEPGRFLVGGDSAESAILCMTLDTGRTWQRVGTGLNGRVNCLAFAPSDRRHLYCGTSDGAYRSADTGRTWQDDGLSLVNAIAYTQNWDVLAGTDSGAFIGRGGYWDHWSYGLVDSVVTSIGVDPSGYDLFAGTSTAGLFRGFGVPGITEGWQTPARQRNAGATVAREVLFLPASGVMGPASCALFDISGRKVMDLHVGANDVHALAPGVYFVRDAQAQAHVQAVRKIVLTE